MFCIFLCRFGIPSASISVCSLQHLSLRIPTSLLPGLKQREQDPAWQPLCPSVDRSVAGRGIDQTYALLIIIWTPSSRPETVVGVSQKLAAGSSQRVACEKEDQSWLCEGEASGEIAHPPRR